MNAGDVIVGVDGSQSSWTALQWAATETRRGGGQLRVILAYRWRPGVQLLVSDEAAEIAEEQAQAIVDLAVAWARDTEPDITVSGTAASARPTTALLDAADGARLLVVGHRKAGAGSPACSSARSASVWPPTHRVRWPWCAAAPMTSTARW